VIRDEQCGREDRQAEHEQKALDPCHRSTVRRGPLRVASA
jgi:hypothetical protein